ncbi:MAG TPA: bifunctional molybdenum cofactor biosynthesis protein MoaC/MoaB [Saprospiraceae bacterium]|nr:bifunctional molybdenum cofactor biosynthesis protein MoaC/MoaB [Saprospiraceae bacterium]
MTITYGNKTIDTMVDITHKITTQRSATAQAIVRVSSQDTITALVNKTVPKGDVLEVARTAGLFAVKNTASSIPDCHPIPVEYTAIRYQIQELEIFINVAVKTIYKTGVEVEAMHGAAIVALTIYDMLKPIDKGVEIGTIKLLSKKGGKSDINDIKTLDVTAAVIVCSDSVSSGVKDDKAGKVIVSKLRTFDIAVDNYIVIPDEIAEIQRVALECKSNNTDLVIFAGGTGLSKRDVTPEAIIPLLDRRIPGIKEAIRSY